MTACRICSGEAVVTHQGKLLERHEVTYFRCPECEYWFTEEPYWLDEAYAEVIDQVDTGLVQRNLTMARELGVLLPRLFPHGPYVDWAGGCGLLVRLMRDAGFDFYWTDKYAENVLANRFYWLDRTEAAGTTATFVSAIEVLEHTPQPMELFREMLEQTGATSIFFTQCLHDGTTYDPNWWYLLPDSGQHISFFSAKTLQTMADQLGMSMHSAGDSHLMTSERIDPKKFRRALRTSKLVSYVARVPGRMSVTPSSLWWHTSRTRTSI